MTKEYTHYSRSATVTSLIDQPINGHEGWTVLQCSPQRFERKQFYWAIIIFFVNPLAMAPVIGRAP
jgi:hypothetical protein